MGNIQEFKTSKNISYSNFDLIGFCENEIIKNDCYSLKEAKDKGLKVNTILDIGANIGIFSYHARNVFPKTKIIAIEAMEDTYIVLKENLKKLGIKMHLMALGETGRTLYPYNDGSHSGSTSFRKDNKMGVKGTKSYSLADMVEYVGAEPPYIIKMDIEGSEAFLIKDPKSSDILKDCMLFTMEYHSINILDKIITKLDWKKFFIEIFVDKFEIKGFEGDPNARGGLFTAMRKEYG